MSRQTAEILPKPAPEGAGTLRIGGARVDLARGRVVAADGTETELRPKTAAFLSALAARYGRLASKEELLAEVWPGVFVDEDGLVQCVSEIRRALGPDRGALRTHAKRGYSLETGETSEGPEQPAPQHWRPAAMFGVLLLAVGLMAGLAGAALWRAEDPAAFVPEPAAHAGPKVAVMPFEAHIPDARGERLARGLTEDVIADLAANDWIFVFADAATRAIGRPDLGAVRALDADYMVTGVVDIGEASGRITAAMADVATGRVVWTRSFEGPVATLPALQRQAADAVAGELAASWTGAIARAEKARARGRGVDDLAAYELYLRAGEHIERRTPDDYAEAEALLRRAVVLEPAFGDAWAKMSYLAYTQVHPEMSQAEMEALWEAGHAAALEALRVAPDRPYPLQQAAGVVLWEDPERAEAMVRRAAALAASDADMLANLAFRAVQLPALAPDAAEWIARAFRLHPDPPAWYDWNRGTVMFVLGRYPEAAEAYGRAPDHVVARAGHVAALALAGGVAAARARLASLRADAPHFSAAWFAEAEGLHPDLAAVFTRGFALAGLEAETLAAGGGGHGTGAASE
jgi:TolB-like protein/DNA-binding winged helix-turn-helix (wHTH) protein